MTLFHIIFCMYQYRSIAYLMGDCLLRFNMIVLFGFKDVFPIRVWGTTSGGFPRSGRRLLFILGMLHLINQTDHSDQTKSQMISIIESIDCGVQTAIVISFVYFLQFWHYAKIYWIKVSILLITIRYLALYNIVYLTWQTEDLLSQVVTHLFFDILFVISERYMNISD